MKRILVAVSLAVLAAPAFSAPFEQTQFDRGLWVTEQRASVGSTQTEGAFADDHNFIAPAQ